MRIAICVGCNHYENFDHLKAAELDASAVFDVLTNLEFGSYETSASVLVKSPSYSQLITVLRNALFDGRKIDCLTFYFAGHGVVRQGSYYLCLKDSVLSALSTTALSLSNLFTVINEISPSQCNILIDACEGGGLVNDVGALIKPELLGHSETPGISIFASSSSTESAAETDEGGLVTLRLLRILKGDVLVQSQRPYLDLVEVGRAIAADGCIERVEQQPVVWGLNLFGQSTFSRNPCFQPGRSSLEQSVLLVPRNVELGNAIRRRIDKIFELYYRLPNSVKDEEILFLLLSVVNETSDDDQYVGSFVLGFAQTCTGRAESIRDSMYRPRVLASAISALTRFAHVNRKVDQIILYLADELVTECLISFESVNESIGNDTNALLSNGIPDLYYLPLRMSRILGWIGAVIEIARCVNRSIDAQNIQGFLVKLLDNFGSSIATISDCQSGYLLAFFCSAFRNGWRAEAEFVFGKVFEDFHHHKGMVASAHLGGDQAFQFLMNRVSAGDARLEFGMLAQPTEILSVLMSAARMFQLEGVVDPYLADLDHLSFNVFVPYSYRSFSEKTIRTGVNHGFQIGHGVWCVEDFMKRWEAACAPQIAQDLSLASMSTNVSALCCSLILPNRCPWFLFSQTH